jgi:hypothetical protein
VFRGVFVDSRCGTALDRLPPYGLALKPEIHGLAFIKLKKCCHSFVYRRNSWKFHWGAERRHQNEVVDSPIVTTSDAFADGIVV